MIVRAMVENVRCDPMFRRIERAVAAMLANGTVVAPVDVLVRTCPLDCGPGCVGGDDGVREEAISRSCTCCATHFVALTSADQASRESSQVFQADLPGLHSDEGRSSSL